METKIESTYVLDEKFAKEYFSYHSYKRPSGIIITDICILTIVGGVINVFAYKKYWAIIAVVLGIYIFVLRVVSVKKNIKISLERDKVSKSNNISKTQPYRYGEAVLLFYFFSTNRSIVFICHLKELENLSILAAITAK